jgi:hypothetical protein
MQLWLVLGEPGIKEFHCLASFDEYLGNLSPATHDHFGSTCGC